MSLLRPSMRAPASAKRLIFRRRAETDHDHSMNAIGPVCRLSRGERFRVKRIVVVPNGILSLQKHGHRAEHWVVVRGTAEVAIRDRMSEVTKTSRSIS